MTKTRRLGLGLRFGSWFGLLGAPIAWTLQHVAGYAMSEASCDPGTGSFRTVVNGWFLVAMIVAGTVAALAEVAAILTFRATRDAEEPPESRIHFLSVIAMTTNPLFFAIILMSGFGSYFLANCQQS